MTSILQKTIFGGKSERKFADVGGVIIPIIQLYSYDVVIYGCGKDISALVSYLWANDVQVKAIIDRDKMKKGRLVLDKVPVLHTEDIGTLEKSENIFVIINVMSIVDVEQMEIMNLLHDTGISKYYTLTPYDRVQICAYACNWVDCGRIDYYRENAELLENVWLKLDDEESRRVMNEYIRAYMERGVYNLPQCDGRKKYFYGGLNENTGCYEELYKHREDEVWINCGAFIGDTIFWYFVNNLSAKRIYAFEGDRNIFKRLCTNLKYLPSYAQQKVTAINEYISEQTEFEKYIQETQITLINADIEGNELEMLKSLSAVIKRDRPVLAISAYHKASDLIDIPKLIDSLAADYVYILRKYEAEVQCYGRTAELVLYAIPRERRV